MCKTLTVSSLKICVILHTSQLSFELLIYSTQRYTTQLNQRKGARSSNIMAQLIRFWHSCFTSYFKPMLDCFRFPSLVLQDKFQWTKQNWTSISHISKFSFLSQSLNVKCQEMYMICKFIFFTNTDDWCSSLDLHSVASTSIGHFYSERDEAILEQLSWIIHG